MMTEEELNSKRIEIGENIRKARIAKGMTCDQLGELTGMKPQTIARIESGLFWMNLKQYVLICNYLQINQSSNQSNS